MIRPEDTQKSSTVTGLSNVTATGQRCPAVFLSTIFRRNLPDAITDSYTLNPLKGETIVDTNISKAYTPKYILYAHGIGGTDKAAYAYVEKNDEGNEILTFALIRLSDNGHEIIDSISYKLSIDSKPHFVYASIDRIAVIGDKTCGLLFQVEDELQGIWKLQIARETAFGCVATEECEVTLNMNWIPF